MASADRTVVVPGSGSITDAGGNTWTITSAGVVAVNGVPDTTTANVIALAYVSGLIWQENSSQYWWSKSVPSDPWSPALGTTTSPLTSGGSASQPATGKFTTSNGKIYDPDGKLWFGRGINEYSNGGSASQLLSLWPGLNFVRCPTGAYDDPSKWDAIINQLTAQKSSA